MEIFDEDASTTTGTKRSSQGIGKLKRRIEEGPRALDPERVRYDDRPAQMPNTP